MLQEQPQHAPPAPSPAQSQPKAAPEPGRAGQWVLSQGLCSADLLLLADVALQTALVGSGPIQCLLYSLLIKHWHFDITF